MEATYKAFSGGCLGHKFIILHFILFVLSSHSFFVHRHVNIGSMCVVVVVFGKSFINNSPCLVAAQSNGIVAWVVGVITVW